MQINNLSMIGFRANPVNKALDVVTDVVGNATRCQNLMGDVITSTGCDYFMSRNYKGEPVKITSLIDAAKAAGSVFDEAPAIISRNGDNFIDTPFGRVTCIEDVVNLFRNKKG